MRWELVDGNWRTVVDPEGVKAVGLNPCDAETGFEEISSYI